MLPFPCTKNTPISACVYVRSAHGSELRMRVLKTFERWQQSADDCLRIIVHGDMQLPWVYDTHA